MFPPDDISSSASVRFLAIGSDNDLELDCGGAGLLVPNPNCSNSVLNRSHTGATIGPFLCRGVTLTTQTFSSNRQ